MEQIPPIRKLDQSDQDTCIKEHFTAEEHVAARNFLKVTGQFATILARGEGEGIATTMVEIDMERFRRGLDRQTEDTLSDTDQAGLLKFANRIDALRDRLPEKTICRLVSVPKGTSIELFREQLLGSSGVSEQVQQEVTQGAEPVIYARSSYVDDMLSGHKAGDPLKEAFMILVYDMEQLRATPMAERERNPNVTGHSLVPKKNSTFQTALKAILEFDAQKKTQ